MKTTKYFSAIIILTISLLLSGCADKSKLLVGTWMVENLKYTRDVPAEMQPQIDRAIAEMRQTFRLTYNADGSYKTQSGTQLLTGKWKLNWSYSVITSTTDKGEQKDYKIMELTENNLSFKATEGSDEVIFEMVRAK